VQRADLARLTRKGYSYKLTRPDVAPATNVTSPFWLAGTNDTLHNTVVSAGRGDAPRCTAPGGQCCRLLLGPGPAPPPLPLPLAPPRTVLRRVAADALPPSRPPAGHCAAGVRHHLDAGGGAS
jgi:hypothetical protein